MKVPSNATEILDLAEKSRLLGPLVVRHLRQKLPNLGDLPRDPNRFLRALVKNQIISQYHARLLAAGRTQGYYIGKYRVLDLLGAGGMGKVFLAEQPPMNRLVAVKIVQAGRGLDPSVLSRFLREARAAAALRHHNIVQAHDCDQADNCYFIVMEYVPGLSLQEFIDRRGSIPWPQAVDFVVQAASGLQHAHWAGLVHRDIKPGNLLLEPSGMIKVLDMGMAVFFHRRDRDLLTVVSGSPLIGTADYIAPEQVADGHSVDIRADIYSLGAVFYFLLTRNVLFPDRSLAQKLLNHQSKMPPPVRDLVPDLPVDVENVLNRMLAKKPDDRFHSPAEVVRALKPFSQRLVPPYDQGEVRFHNDQLKNWLRYGPDPAEEFFTRSGQFFVPTMSNVDSSAFPAVSADTPPPVQASDKTVVVPSPRLVTVRELRLSPAPGPESTAILDLPDSPLTESDSDGQGIPRLETTDLAPRHNAGEKLVGDEHPVDEVSFESTSSLANLNLEVPDEVLSGNKPPSGAMPAATFGSDPANTFADGIADYSRFGGTRRLLTWRLSRRAVALLAATTIVVTSLMCWLLPRRSGQPAMDSSPDSRRDATAKMPLPFGDGSTRTRGDTPADRWRLENDREALRGQIRGVQFPKELVAILGEGGRRHWEPAVSVANSPDGLMIASASGDGTIRLWDRKTYSALRVLDAHAGPLTAVAFAPRGEVVVGGYADGHLRFWNTSTGDLVKKLSAHRGAVADVVYSRDGRVLFSLGRDQYRLQGWNTDDFAPLQHWPTSGEGLSLAIDPRGAWIACATRQETIEVRHLVTGQIVQAIVVPGTNACALAFHPRQPWLYVASFPDGLVSVWEVATGRKLFSFVGHPPLSPIVDSEVFALQRQSITSLTFHADGSRLYGAGEQPICWNPADGTELFRGRLDYPPGRLSKVICQDDLLITSSRDHGVYFWDAGSGASVYRTPPAMERFALAPDDQWMATIQANSLVLHDLRQPLGEQTARTIPLDEPARHWAVSGGGKTLAAASSKTTTIWNGQTGTRQAVLTASMDILAIAMRPDGGAIAISTNSPGIAIHDTNQGNELREMEGIHEFGPIHQLSFSPNGEMLAGIGDRLMGVWITRTGALARKQRISGARLETLTFSPSGKNLVAGTRKGPIWKWDLTQNRVTHWLMDYSAEERVFAVSPLGDLVALAEPNGGITLWHRDQPDSSPRKLTIGPSNSSVRQMAFDHRGRYLFAAHGDGAIGVYHIVPTTAH